MSWWEILIIIAAAAFVIGVIAFSVVRKKQGKTSCGCGDCASCGCCKSCRKEEQPARKK